MRERQLYGIILALAVALAGLGGYLIALVRHGQGGQQGGPETVPFIEPSQGAQPRTIVVAGLGRAAARPNLAGLRLGVATQATTAAEALAQNAESMGRVIEAMKAMGIPEEDIETARFSLYPRYSRETLIGFEAAHILELTTTDLDRVGRLIDGAVGVGANRVETVYFAFTEGRIEELSSLARQRAVEDARAKAEAIASSLGVRIVGIASAVEEAYRPYREEWYGAPPVPTPPPTPIVPPTEVEVTVMIKVTFIIE